MIVISCTSLLVGAAVIAAQSAASTTSLNLGESQMRVLNVGQSESFALKVSAGQFAHLVVEKQGVDAAVSVSAPDGRQILTLTYPNGAFGPEPISWIAKQTGTFTVKIDSPGPTHQKGTFKIAWLDLRSPKGADSREIEAERLLMQAASSELEGTHEKTQNAIALYEQSSATWHDLADKYEEAFCLYRIGRIYGRAGEFTKALDYHRRALPIAQAAGERSLEARLLTNLALDLDTVGQGTKGLDYLTQALPLERAIADRASEGITLQDFGKVYDDLGEKEKSLAYFEQALAVYRELGNQSGIGDILYNQGKLLADMGQWESALKHYEQALAIYQAVGNRAGQAWTLNNVARVYAHTGNPKKALEYFDQVLVIHRELGNRAGEALVLNNIGSEWAQLEDSQKALALFLQALSIQREIGDRTYEAMTLENIASLYSDLHQGAKALDYFDQALHIQRDVGDRDGEASTLLNIGILYNQIGQSEKAVPYLNDALPIERSLKDREDEAATLNQLRIAYGTSAPPLAVLFGKQAVNVIQTIRQDNRGLDPALIQSFESSVGEYYRGLANLLVSLSRFAEAEEVLNLLKDKETADYIERDEVSDQLRPVTMLDSERATLNRYDQIVNQIATEGQRRTALLSKRQQGDLSPSEVTESLRLDEDLSASNLVLNRFLNEEQNGLSPQTALSKRVGEVRRTSGLQSALQKLGPGTVAIYTLVTGDKYVAILVTGGARKAYVTRIKQADLNRKIFAFRQSLENPTSNPLPPAQELYHIVFPEHLRQDLDAINVKAILWSMDSTLRYVPIGALHDGHSYLVESFRSSMINPESLLSLTEANSARWVGEGFGVSLAHPPFTALPSVPDELHLIFGTAANAESPVAGPIRLDAAFDATSMRKDLASKVSPIIHIATHFDAEPGEAARSNLLLGDGTRLSLAELASDGNLFEGADLVTLSACSTAMGEGAADGREVDSMAVVAQTIGAKSVLASLWSVSDTATASLMQHFYQNWKNHPESGKSEALRQAQVQMATGVVHPVTTTSDGDRGLKRDAQVPIAVGWTHPFYWAAFVLIGNIR